MTRSRSKSRRARFGSMPVPVMSPMPVTRPMPVMRPMPVTRSLAVMLAMPVLLAVAVLAGVMAGGCKGAAGGARPAQAYVAPEWESLDIRTIAYVSTGSSAGDETARLTAEQVVEQQLAAGQDEFVVLGVAQSRARAGTAGAGELFTRLSRVWRDSRTADPLLVQELAGKLGVDGLLVADLSDWLVERVDWNVEGSSATQIRLRLAILSGRTGALAWEAEKIHRKESVRHVPGQAGSGIYTSGGVQRAERPLSGTPEPPRPEIVAAETVQSIMAAFPRRPR